MIFRRSSALIALAVAAVFGSSMAPAASLASPGAQAGPTVTSDSQPAGTLRMLAAGVFDPTKGLPAGLTMPTAASDGLMPYLLQLQPGTTAAAVRALDALGIQRLEYVPRDGFLVRIPSSRRSTVAAASAVRAIVPLPNEWKRNPNLAGKTGMRSLFLATYPGMDLTALAARIANAGLATVLQKHQADSYGLLAVRADLANLAALSAVGEIRWIEEVPAIEFHNADSRWVTQTGKLLDSKLSRLGLVGARVPGDATTAQVAAVADTGLDFYANEIDGFEDPGHDAFADRNGDGTTKAPDYWGAYNADASAIVINPGAGLYSHRKMAIYEDLIGDGHFDSGGSGHGTHTAGSVAGDMAPYGAANDFDGMAPAARLAFQDVGNDEEALGGLPSAILGDLAVLYDGVYDIDGNAAYTPGLDARVHSNSWGSAIPTNVLEGWSSDVYVWNHPDMVVTFSAGNGGPGAATIGDPGAAKNIICVGASYNGNQYYATPDDLASFSSHGPIVGGGILAIKPDVVAPGAVVTSADSDTQDRPNTFQGTSMSNPVVAGNAVLVREYYYDGWAKTGQETRTGSSAGDGFNPSAALVKATIINSAARMHGRYTGDDASQEAIEEQTRGTWPSYGQGWGQVRLDDALYFSGDRRKLVYSDDQTVSLLSPLASIPVTVASANEPVEITLAWTDEAASLEAGLVQVNNLNLIVQGPDGLPYLGNNFASRLDGAASDDSLPTGAPDASNNVETVRFNAPTPGTYTVNVAWGGGDPLTEQPFALVATGDLIASSADIQVKPESAKPATQVAVQVTDSGATGQSAVANWSSPRGSGTLALPVTDVAHVYGANVTVGTAAGSTLVAGSGETVTLTYKGVTHTLTVDAAAPTITATQDLELTSDRTTIVNVTTNEPSAVQLRIGALTVGSSDSVTAHRLTLEGLTPGSSGTATITATDAAGNAGTSTLRVKTARLFTPLENDVGYFETDTTGIIYTDQAYVGSAEGLNQAGAVMFDLSSRVPTTSLEAAVVRLHTKVDWTSKALDPYVRYKVEVLPSSAEGTFTGLTYAEFAAIAADYDFSPIQVERRGTDAWFAFQVPAERLAAFKTNATDGKVLLRLSAVDVRLSSFSLFGVDRGYGIRSRGPEYKPQLLLYPTTGLDPQVLPVARAGEPTISGASAREIGGAIYASWDTDRPADSVLGYSVDGAPWAYITGPSLEYFHQLNVSPGSCNVIRMFVASTDADGQTSMQALPEIRSSCATVQTMLEDNAENAADLGTKWTTGSPAWTRATDVYHQGAASYFSGDLADGGQQEATLTTASAINLNGSSGSLTFWSKLQKEPNDGTDADEAVVEGKRPADGSWTTLASAEDYCSLLDGPTCDTAWRSITVDLSAFAGGEVLLRFRYTTDDHNYVDVEGAGWRVDEIAVAQRAACTYQTSTAPALPPTSAFAEESRRPEPTAMSMAASPTLGVWGTPFTLSGSLLSGSIALPSRLIRLQSKPAAGSTWSVVGSTSTDSSGAWTFIVRPSESTDYRVVFAGDDEYLTVTSSTARVGVRVGVVLNTSATSVAHGGTVYFSGKVLPSHAGSKVHLQVYQGKTGTWAYVNKDATLDSSSAYRVGYSTTYTGGLLFRMVFWSDASHVWNVSRNVRVTWS